MLTPELNLSVQILVGEFELIPLKRKVVLRRITDFIETNRKAHLPIYLNFICTHNSRRSHMAQLWAQAVAYYYHIADVACYSGGTEATAFNPNAANAMRDCGFIITTTATGNNPVHVVHFADDAEPVIAFSKTFDDAFNPSENFLAIMTCSHADENCPLISGASGRVAITYDDPKEFDSTGLADTKYKERAMEIGRELMWAFSQVKNEDG